MQSDLYCRPDPIDESDEVLIERLGELAGIFDPVPLSVHAAAIAAFETRLASCAGRANARFR
jgi:hypothetical protein